MQESLTWSFPYSLEPYTPMSLKLLPGLATVTEVGFAVAKHEDETPETLIEVRTGSTVSSAVFCSCILMQRF